MLARADEFTSEGGKLYPAVKGVMDSTDMLAKSFMICEKARAAGAQVIHAPIMFKADASDNPNKSLGILAGCAKDGLFTEHTWNSEFCPQMQPMPGDKIVEGNFTGLWIPTYAADTRTTAVGFKAP